MRRIGAACLLLLASSTQAATFYKCVDRNGQASYQSQPCSPLASTAWSRPYQPEPPTPRSRGLERAPPAARTNRIASPRMSVRAVRPPPDPCTIAKTRRERVLAKVGLKRTFDLLRQLDDEVYEACK